LRQVGQAFRDLRRELAMHSLQNRWRHSFVVTVEVRISLQMGHIISASRSFLQAEQVPRGGWSIEATPARVLRA
jgi:hypothetical protein